MIELAGKKSTPQAVTVPGSSHPIRLQNSEDLNCLVPLRRHYPSITLGRGFRATRSNGPALLGLGAKGHRTMPIRKRILSACLSIFGLTSLAYVGGGAAMYFQLPSSELLARSLIGARAWFDGRRTVPPQPVQVAARRLAGAIDVPSRTCDGFTLYACVGGSADQPYTQAYLINMHRERVHRWSILFSEIWPLPSHIPTRVPNSETCFFACHLYPNGDLLAVIHGRTTPMGCGLVKLDQDSNVLWAYPAAIHHDVDVAEDGSIYAIQHEIAKSLPNGLEGIDTPCEIDYLHHISPDGKLIGEPISIFAAFQDTPYEALLDVVKRPIKPKEPAPWAAVLQSPEIIMHDPLHTNSVKTLTRDFAPRFPLFRAGQVLISIRSINALAVLDPLKGKIVWAARGPWHAQHDAQFLDNGRLLLFDNLGVAMGSRVLEYDPQTQAIPWVFAGPPGVPFYSKERGFCQRLPNGNTLIVNWDARDIIEATSAQEIVWSCNLEGNVCTARRYAREQLPFLDGGTLARP